MYICLAGKNDIAVSVLEELIKYKNIDKNINLLCSISKNDIGINGWQRSLKFYCDRYQIPIVKLNDIYKLSDLLFLSCEYDRLIDTNKFRSDRLFNIHFSLLPKYKGMYTAILPILYGDKETGVTLHKIDNGIDTGDIVAQKRIVIESEDTSYDVYRKNIAYGTDLVIKFLPKLIYGYDKIKAMPQSHGFSSYFSKKAIDFQSLELDINTTASMMQRQVRAFAFRPYQLLKYRGIPICWAQVLKDRTLGKPGDLLKEDENKFILTSIDYNVILYKDRFEYLLKAIAQKENDKVFATPLLDKYMCEKNLNGWTPLMVATYNNNKEIFYYLLKNGGNIHDLNNNGTNILMFAKDSYVNTGDSELFEVLYNLGLSIYEKDYNGMSLKDYCKLQGIQKIGKLKI